jgi:multicomponent Na+:H+ antiporter subunit D
MEILTDLRPLWAVLISAVAALLILFSDKKPNLRETWTIIAAVAKLAIVASMLPAVLSGTVIQTAPLKIAYGIELYLKADAFGMLFALLASGLWLITSFYSIGYMRGCKETHQTGYFASFALSLSATMGIAFAGNLLTFFIFYEVLTLATYPLVVHKRNGEAVDAGRKYLAYNIIAAQLMLIAIVWAYVISGTSDFASGGFLAGTASLSSLRILFILMIAGPIVKAAVMPLHEWLPAAMVAPTPVSALLHAVAVVKAGAFGVLRIVGYVFGPELLSQMGVLAVLSWFAAATIIISSLIAMRQDNLKRRLAFSTIGQLSYCVLGASIGTPLAILGAMFHMVAHAFMKIVLFFCAGAIHVTAHKDNISEMKGIGRKMPLTMAAFAISSFGIAGLPPLVGFLSKWNLALGAIEGGQAIFIAILIASALLSATYLIPVAQMAFFTRKEEFNKFGETRLDMLIPILLCVGIVLVLGLFPDAFANFYELAVMSSQEVTKSVSVILGGGW